MPIAGPLRMTSGDKKNLRDLRALEQAKIDAADKVGTELALGMQNYAEYTCGPAHQLVLSYMVPGNALSNIQNVQLAITNRFFPINTRGEILGAIQQTDTIKCMHMTFATSTF